MNRMRKIMGLMLVLALVLSSATTAFAGDNGNGKANGKGKKAQIESVSGVDMQKVFKAELNMQKKEVAKAKGALEEQQALLKAQYDAMVAAGTSDDAALAGIEAQIAALDTEIASLQVQMKQIINERFMIIKTTYNDEELARFENAAAAIAQMYADASVLGAGSIVVKNNIIKLEAPAYMKGGRTIIPVRAITEELGATVIYDVLTKTVTVSKDGIDIVFSINSATVFVNGVEQVLDAPAEITNGRTYVPLRFIAETFGLEVSFDSETGTIDIDEDTDADDEAADEETGEEDSDPVTEEEPEEPTEEAVE